MKVTTYTCDNCQKELKENEAVNEFQFPLDVVVLTPNSIEGSSRTVRLKGVLTIVPGAATRIIGPEIHVCNKCILNAAAVEFKRTQG